MFLFDKGDSQNLSKKIKEVLDGDDVYCAVAFLGAGAKSLFGYSPNNNKSLKIVCDTSMGGTSPQGISLLGAPNNENLRYHDKLHAKVYFSENGAVVSSANASTNALAILEGYTAKHTEAGFFISPNTNEWQSIKCWIEELFSKSKVVDQEQVDRVIKAKSNATRKIEGSNISLLSWIKSYPERFGDIGIVFTRDLNKEGDIEEAIETAKKEFPENISDIETWNRDDMWTDWDENDIISWPDIFLSFHLEGESKLYLDFYTRHFSTKNGIFGKEIWAKLEAEINCAPLIKEEVAKNDRETCKKIMKKIVLDGNEAYLCKNAYELIKIFGHLIK